MIFMGFFSLMDSHMARTVGFLTTNVFTYLPWGECRKVGQLVRYRGGVDIAASSPLPPLLPATRAPHFLVFRCRYLALE